MRENNTGGREGLPEEVIYKAKFKRCNKQETEGTAEAMRQE